MKRFFLLIIIITSIAIVLMQCEKRENIDDLIEIQWTTYTTEDGLVSNNVFAIAIDKEGNKWIGTSGGVSKFDGTTWTTYTLADGLAGNIVTAIAIDAEDNKWFGTCSWNNENYETDGTGVSKLSGGCK